MVRWAVSLNRVLICPSPLPTYRSAALLGIIERTKLRNVGEIGKKEKGGKGAARFETLSDSTSFKQFTKAIDVEKTEGSSERAKA